MCIACLAWAEEMSVPAVVQAKLLTRVLLFDRNQAARAPAEVVVLVLVRHQDSDSSSAALHLERALLDIGSVRGEPLRALLVEYTDAASVAREVRLRRASVVYLTPGLGPHVPAIATALTGSSVLTFAAIESYVPAGAVMGVDIVSGKPLLSINLRQAKLQYVDLPADILKLTKVYR